MSILRFDQTVSDWVIFAPSRAQRPHEFRGHGRDSKADLDESNGCPFCPGNEALTPPEIYAERAHQSASSAWLVRVVPNKFPALRIEEDARRHEEGNGLRSMDGCGAHEIIVESPHHGALLAEQPVEQIQRILGAAQLRWQDLMRDSRFQTVTVFKNHGAGAGTSMRHPHWQLIATPVVPRLLRVMQSVANDYFDLTGASLYRVMLQDELARGTRIAAANEHFVALLPYASHLPFETWIFPRRHQSSFAALEAGRIPPLAETLKTVLLKLLNGLDNPDFNLSIASAARGAESDQCFSWHIRITPRLTTPAGFELGSGMSINPVLPEDAAEYLQSVAV